MHLKLSYSWFQIPDFITLPEWFKNILWRHHDNQTKVVDVYMETCVPEAVIKNMNK